MKNQFDHYRKTGDVRSQKKKRISANVGIIRSFWSEVEEIWRNGEPSHFSDDEVEQVKFKFCNEYTKGYAV